MKIHEDQDLPSRIQQEIEVSHGEGEEADDERDAVA
jgi:hypothetical protein